MDNSLLNPSSDPMPLHFVPASPCVPPGARVKGLAVATAFALLCLPAIGDAQAQSIGALDVRSRLGERFFGSVPIRMDSGYLDPRCIRVLPNPNAPAGADPLPATRIRIGSVDSVIIETTAAVNSPIVGLRLEVGCDNNTVSRDFVVLSEFADAGGDAAGQQRPAAAPAGQDVSPPATVAVAPPPTRAERPTAAPRAPVRRARPAEPPAPPATISADPGAAPSAATAPVARPQPAAGPAATPALATQNAQRLSELQARSDDQAAALLALEDRLALLQKQAELLKLQLEQALATRQASAAAQPGTTETAQTAAPAPAASAPAQAVPATAAAVPPAPPQVVQQAPRKEPGMLDLLLDWRVSGGLAALLIGALAFKLRRRPMLATDKGNTRTPSAKSAGAASMAAAPAADPAMFAKTGEFQTTSAFNAQSTAEWPSALKPPAAGQTAEWLPPPAAPTTDSFPVPSPAPAPSMTDSQRMRAAPAAMSREFHITQQFQPNTERVVALSSPEEIVQQARTHYMDDRDAFRAIDLLEMAVSVRKDSPRPWQALFAIYRRESMAERFQRLALAYRSTFGEDDNWKAILGLGRGLDPENPLYLAGAPQDLPEDLLERWLGVPLDFTAHLLANEMHDQLMSTTGGRRRRKLAQ